MRAVLGTRKGVLVLQHGSKGWALEHAHFDGVNAPYVAIDQRQGRIWAGLNHGHWGVKLHYSDDQGKTFTEVASPAFAESDNEKVKQIWAMAFDPDGRIYAGTAPAALFCSDDQGKSWTHLRALYDEPTKTGWFGGGAEETCLHSILVDPRDKNHLMIAISCAGVLESEDAGKSWSYRNKGMAADFLPDPTSEVGQDPHLIYRAPSHVETIWQQNHCGLYRTDDNAKSWTNLSQTSGLKSKFGFAVACSDDNPDVAFTVPAVSDEVRVPVDRTLYVQKTTDGGQTWRAIDNGLPQGQCWDIVYRHALGLKQQHVMIGTTTGGVFASDDLGESWQEVSLTFPPVYSVELM